MHKNTDNKSYNHRKRERGVMQDTYLLQKLKTYDNQLTKTERALQEYILKNAPTLKNMRILALESATGISKSTISRYCKKMGFSNFRDFSTEIAQEVAFNYSNIHVAASVGDSSQAIAQKLYSLESETLKTTCRMLDYSHMDRAVRMVLSANVIHAYAVGGAVPIAQDFYHKMLRIGKQTLWQQDFISQQMQAKTATAADLAFVFTISGYEECMLEIASTLSGNHTKFICVTSGYQSAVTTDAELSLYGAYRNDFTYTGTIESRLSLMYVVDLLFILLSMSGAPETTDKIKLTKEVLEHNKRHVKA